jgi:hypothetical protein
MRPLQKLIDANSPTQVVSCSSEAFNEIRSNNDWKAAINILCRLKGVGVATASAVLAVYAPNLCPFMADEVIESVGLARDYDMRTYEAMLGRLSHKCDELGRQLVIEDIGKALWSAAILGSSSDGTEDISITKKKRKQDNNDETTDTTIKSETGADEDGNNVKKSRRRRQLKS